MANLGATSPKTNAVSQPPGIKIRGSPTPPQSVYWSRRSPTDTKRLSTPTCELLASNEYTRTHVDRRSPIDRRRFIETRKYRTPSHFRESKGDRSSLVVKNRPMVLARPTGGLAPAARVWAVIFLLVRSCLTCGRSAARWKRFAGRHRRSTVSRPSKGLQTAINAARFSSFENSAALRNGINLIQTGSAGQGTAPQLLQTVRSREKRAAGLSACPTHLTLAEGRSGDTASATSSLLGTSASLLPPSPLGG